MKKAKNHRPHYASHNYPAYPNAADKSYFVHKTLDIITAILSAVGFAVAMVFIAAFV